MSKAADDVLAERERQKTVEGRTVQHDSMWRKGQLAAAAGSYALWGEPACALSPPQYWPWDRKWWKPTSRRQSLVKAGALILAEIERLDRIEDDRIEGHPPTRNMFQNVKDR
jgi:hypothetical protein